MNFVLVGALILIPLLLLSDAVNYLNQPPLVERIETEICSGCIDGFGKNRESTISEAELDSALVVILEIETVKTYFDDKPLREVLAYGVEGTIQYYNSKSEALFGHSIEYSHCEMRFL